MKGKAYLLHQIRLDAQSKAFRILGFMMQSRRSSVNTHHLLGLGLDNRDGHKRLTQGEKFSVVGGSQETHESMTETLVKTMEDLKKRGKALEQTESREIEDLLQKHSS